MTIDELMEKDKDFTSSSFISKANNKIKKIYNAITLNQLDTIKHFLSDRVFNDIQQEQIEAKEKNLDLVYDEVNVNCEINNIKEDEDFYIIEVNAIIKYLKYYLSQEGQVVKGNDDERLTYNKKVIFKKKKDSQASKIHTCLGCGMNIDINNNGKCPQCGRIYALDDFDYIIDSIE